MFEPTIFSRHLLGYNVMSLQTRLRLVAAPYTPDSLWGFAPLDIEIAECAHLRPPPAPSGDCVLGRGTNDGPSHNFSSGEAVAAELRHHIGRSPICFSSLTAAHLQFC